MKKIITLLILIAFATLAWAIDVKPYPTADITADQWNNYHELVSKNLASSRRAYDSHKLEVFSDEKTRASIAFTMPGHEAHPCWVTRYVTEENGEVSLSVIGYFAGNEEAFKKLFYQYEAMAEQTRKQFRK